MLDFIHFIQKIMKNFIKKLSVVTLLGLVFFAQAGVANAAWTYLNTDPQDLETVTVRNSSDAGNCNDCGDWSSSTTASDGDTIAVAIYYHVTGASSADDLRFKLDTPSGVSETSDAVTIKGTVVADNASAVSQTVTVYLPDNGKLTYKPGSAKWYPDQTDTPESVPFDEYDMFDASGGSVGTIGTGWSHQGSLVVSYTVDVETNISNPDVDTNEATSVDASSTTLNGDLIDLGGDTNATVWFEWGTSEGDLNNDTSSSTLSDTTTFSKTINDLDEGETYYFRAVAQNDAGTAYGAIKDFYIDNGGDTGDNNTLNASTLSEDNVDDDSAELNGEVEAGDHDVDNCWFEWGDDDNDLNETENVDCSLNDGDTDSYSETITGLNDDETYYFRFCAEDTTGDEDCGSIQSFTTDNNNGDNNDNDNDVDIANAPNVVTTVATSITSVSAKFNGLMTDSNGETSYGFFEWGTTTSLPFTTVEQTLGTSDGITFWNIMGGLTPNTTYYFRACAKNIGGVDCGDILSFRTLPSTTTVVTPVTTVTTVSTTGVGGGSNLVLISINSPFEDACLLDTVDFNVEWENISGRDLENVVIQIALQNGLTFVRTSEGDYVDEDHAIVYEIGDLDRGEDGDLTFEVKINSKADTAEPLVTTAVMSFTNPTTKAQDDAIAYDLIDLTKCGGGLGAFALFGGEFGILWILLFIILLLVIALLVRTLYTKKKVAPVYGTYVPPMPSEQGTNGTAPNGLPR